MEMDTTFKFAYENSLKNKRIDQKTTLEQFKLKFTNPVSQLPDENQIINDYYRDLHFLIFPKGIKPVLEVGNHRRNALAQVFELKTANSIKEVVKDWPQDYSQLEV